MEIWPERALEWERVEKGRFSKRGTLEMTTYARDPVRLEHSSKRISFLLINTFF